MDDHSIRAASAASSRHRGSRPAIRELSGIEINASSTVSEQDIRGLRKLRDASGKRFRTGLVIYDGDMVIPFGDRLFAVPVSSLWL